MSEKEKKVTKKQMLIAATAKVIAQYQTKLTVRQIFYRLVSEHLIPNTQQEYHYLVGALVDARWAGDIPFRAIEDRTRSFLAGDDDPTSMQSHFSSWLRAFRNNDELYDLPTWTDQPKYIEVWLEKQALQGLFDPICRETKVKLFPCRGYPSLTKLYESAQRLKVAGDKGIKILYFGDYDPSGQDIPRKVEEDLTRFGLEFTLDKIAITAEQIEEYKIPPFPAKTTDPRFAKFAAEYGEDAVELDAIDPDVLQDIIKKAIQEHFDEDIRAEVLERQEADREDIRKLTAATLKPEKKSRRKTEK